MVDEKFRRYSNFYY